ncbi:MAG TPA: hypothetical protein VFH47_06640 [Candidatus Thermoplasmatota archaeon]|nr:hypothetical protein [Candidatus Thermoplasmatota archaeon]
MDVVTAGDAMGLQLRVLLGIGIVLMMVLTFAVSQPLLLMPTILAGDRIVHGPRWKRRTTRWSQIEEVVFMKDGRGRVRIVDLRPRIEGKLASIGSASHFEGKRHTERLAGFARAHIAQHPAEWQQVKPNPVGRPQLAIETWKRVIPSHIGSAGHSQATNVSNLVP